MNSSFSMNCMLSDLDQINYNTANMYLEILYIQYDSWIVDPIIHKIRDWKNTCTGPCFPKRKYRWLRFLSDHLCKLSYHVSVHEFNLLKRDVEVYGEFLYGYIKASFDHILDTAKSISKDIIKITVYIKPEVLLTLLIKKGIVHDRPYGTKMTII